MLLAGVPEGIAHSNEFRMEQRLAKTRVLKEGMMQEPLTGKTRLA